MTDSTASVSSVSLSPNGPLQPAPELWKNLLRWCGSEFEQRSKRSSGRPHMCETCGKQFTLLENLNRHQMIHTNQRPFHCTHCSKSFRLSQHLKEHIRIHTGEKPYKCSTCGHAFCQISNLKSHQKTHTKVKGFRCEQCGKEFRRSFTLKQHKLTHSKPSRITGDAADRSTSGQHSAWEKIKSSLVAAGKASQRIQENNTQCKKLHNDQIMQQAKQSPSSYTSGDNLSSALQYSASSKFESPLRSRVPSVDVVPPPLVPMWNSFYQNLNKSKTCGSKSDSYINSTHYSATLLSTLNESRNHVRHQTPEMLSFSDIGKYNKHRFENILSTSMFNETISSQSDVVKKMQKDRKSSFPEELKKEPCSSPSTSIQWKDFRIKSPNTDNNTLELTNKNNFKTWESKFKSQRCEGNFAFKEKMEMSPLKTGALLQASKSCLKSEKAIRKSKTPPDRTSSVNHDYKWKRQLCKEWREPFDDKEVSRSRSKSTDMPRKKFVFPEFHSLKPPISSSSTSNKPSLKEHPPNYKVKESRNSCSIEEDDVFSPLSLTSCLSAASSEVLSSSKSADSDNKSMSGKRSAIEENNAFQYSNLLMAKRSRKFADAETSELKDIVQHSGVHLNNNAKAHGDSGHSYQPVKSTNTPYMSTKSLENTTHFDKYSAQSLPYNINDVIASEMKKSQKEYFSLDSPFLYNADLSINGNHPVLVDFNKTSIPPLPFTSAALNHPFAFNTQELDSVNKPVSFIPLVTWKPVVTGWRNVFDGKVYPTPAVVQ